MLSQTHKFDTFSKHTKEFHIKYHISLAKHIQFYNKFKIYLPLVLDVSILPFECARDCDSSSNNRFHKPAYNLIYWTIHLLGYFSIIFFL